MERTKLSADKTFGQFFIIAIGSLVVVGLLASSQYVGALMGLAISGFIFTSISGLKLLEFDSDNLYIIESKMETAIPLRNIQRVVSTNRRVNGLSVWEITWADETYAVFQTPFLPNEREVLETFVQLVEAQAPDVNLKRTDGFQRKA